MADNDAARLRGDLARLRDVKAAFEKRMAQETSLLTDRDFLERFDAVKCEIKEVEGKLNSLAESSALGQIPATSRGPPSMDALNGVDPDLVVEMFVSESGQAWVYRGRYRGELVTVKVFRELLHAEVSALDQCRHEPTASEVVRRLDAVSATSSSLGAPASVILTSVGVSMPKPLLATAAAAAAAAAPSPATKASAVPSGAEVRRARDGGVQLLTRPRAVAAQLYERAMRLLVSSDGTVPASQVRAATDLLLQAAQLGHARAVTCVGYFRRCPFGGIDGNEREASVLLQRAARELVDPLAVLCVVAYLPRDAWRPSSDECAAAYALLRAGGVAAVPAWDAFARCVLADATQCGIGCERNVTAALSEYRALAACAFAPAHYSLGTCYERGIGVDNDKREAVKWYKLAAKQGHSAAQCILAVYYEHGIGVDRDQREAVKWYELAAKQGHAAAQFWLAVYYEHGIGVDRDQREAVKWYELAAEQGHAVAQYYLGVCYQNGEGVAKDEREAVKWFKLAAEQGYDRAVAELRRRGITL